MNHVCVTADELVWDMDGTLLDSTEVVPAAFVRTVRALGGPTVDAAKVVATYAAGPPEVILKRLTGRTLAPEETELYYVELATAQAPPYSGVRTTLDRLRDRGRFVAVFTGASTGPPPSF